MLLPILSAAVQILDIVLKKTAKNPETAPQFAPITSSLISLASQAAEETEAETLARLGEHNALIAKYAAAPPAGVAP